ncbi:MAG: Activator of Hsp90 ATPase [Acidobacteria bacterium]|nr:Activator of Hsp90 ATPase [Acidobacteriota bacterium]
MSSPPSLDVTAVIAAPPGRVLKAFFDAEALNAWWQVAHSVTTPRVLGPYAIEWEATDFCDDVLGRLGGVFRGTIVQFRTGEGFFVADAFWLPPDGEPIGPMALEVTLQGEATGTTRVRVTQTGFEESARWRRYYEVIGVGWTRALASLKSLLER